MSAIESLNSFGRWLIPYLGRLSLELAVLAAVVLVAILLLRVRSARLRHVFWGLVLAKPVATLLIASPFSLYWFLKPPTPEPPPPAPPRVVASAPRTYVPRPVMRYERPPMVRTAPPPAPPWWRRLDEHGVAAGVWIGISSLLALRLLVGFAFVGFLRKTAEPQRAGPLPEAAREAARALGMRRPVRVSISPIAHGPVLAGVLRPEVLLPGELVENLPEHQLRLIIAHESAHARRKDNLVLLIQRLAEVFLFFHPAVWLCGWAMRRDAEAACDDAVLAAHADAQAEYAGSLIEVAAITRRRRGGLTRKLLINTFAATETRFTQRVSRILEGRRRRMTLGLTVSALAALTIIGILGLPTAAAPKSDEAKTEKEGGKVATEDRKVQREEGKVWIEGMEGVDWGGSFFTREDSQARCLVEALRCAGKDVGYADVMGLSGAAFKLTMAPDLFVAEIHSEMGMDWPEIVRRVWGLQYDWQAISFSDEQNPDWREELLQAAAESIDRGVPLFYMNGEWNLLVGYREDGSAFICKPYAGDEEGYKESETPTGFVGDAWFASVLRESGEPAERRESIVRSLQTAVRMSTRPAESDGNRLFGFDAYEAWIAALEETPDEASKHGNAFSYSQLLTSRQAAAQYLRRAADELDDEGGDQLLSAAGRYEAIAERLDEGKVCVALPWDQSWTAENRAREVSILRECMADEKVAVAGIESALAALGRPAYRAPDQIRPELRNMLNFGRGIYPAPGLAPEEERTWAAVFEAEGEERLERFARMAERHGCSVAEYGDAVLWLNDRGRIDALFYLVDGRDLAGFRRFFDLLVETGSPLAYTIVECPDIYDVLSHQPDWYIRHNNQFDRPTPEVRTPDPAVREDVLGIEWSEVWPDVAARASLPADQFRQELAEMAGEYGCTQAVEDGLALWRDADDQPVAIFAVCEDTDLQAIRRLYAALDEKDCPLAWLFLRLTHWEEPVFDILSLSRNHYMAHRARVGPWHRGLYPDQPATATEGEAMAGDDATTQVVLDLPGMPEGLRDEALFERGCQYQAGVARAYVWALRQAGVDIDFTEFTALSGWAFSFVYRYGGTPQVGIRVRGTPGSRGPGETFQIADWFGLDYETCPTDDADRLWRFIRKHIDAGRPIISEHLDGGLITGYRTRDGKRQARFVGPVGGPWVDVDDYEPFEVCALVPRGAPLPEHDLYLEGLRRAVYCATMPEWGGTATGLAALDAYVTDVADSDKDFANQTEWFCWASRNRLDARVCAAEWLGRAARELDSAALRSAASHYADASRFYVQFHEALVVVTDSMVARERWDLAGAVPLLRQAVEAERAGLAEIGAYLRAQGEEGPEPLARDGAGALASNVRREDGRTWIESMDELTWPRHQESSTLRSLAIALQSIGEDVTYEWLMGVSGLAFRVQVMEDGLCPSSPHACCGFNAYEVALDAIDYAAIPHDYTAGGALDKDNPDDVAATNRAVVASVERGWPVLFGSEEDGLVVGYQDRGETLLVRGYSDSGKPPGFYPMEGWPWGFAVLQRKDQPVDRRGAIVRSLKLAVDLARRPRSGDYTSGFAALRQWADLLRQDDEAFAAEDEKHEMGIQHGNAYLYVCMVDARGCAANYLRTLAEELGDEARPHLLAAAEGYDEVLAKLLEGFPNAPFKWDPKGKSWSRQMRLAEADTLAQVAEIERRAIGQIAAALTALGEPVPEEPAGGPAEGARMWEQVEIVESVWGAGLPTGITLALRKQGADVRYADVAAASGWAFSFDYDYENWHLAALRLDQFDWLPEQLGCRLEDISCRDRDGTWEFIRRHLDASTPVITTLGDGGLINAYRTEDGERQILFDGEPVSGWLGVDNLHPMDRCAVLVQEGSPRPRDEVARESLVRAMGAAQRGLPALEAYLADVRDPGKDFEDKSEWFCWATFERLTGRKCCADWLRHAADVLGGQAEEPLRAAADHYERAFERYSEYDRLVHEDEGSGRTLQERLRTPERIAELSPVLEGGIEQERAAIAELGAALRAIGEATLSRPGAPSAPASSGGSLPENVRREDGVVWIEGLEGMDWGGSYFEHQDTFMACMTEVLRCAGEDVTYAEVMGLSASAFKITMMENCHPGATQGHVGVAAWSPDGTPMVWEQSGNPLNFHSNIMRIFGITWSHIDLNPDDTPDWRERLLAAVRESVNRGIPVFYMDGEWGLIVGYREDGSAFICRHEGMGPGYEEMQRPRGVIGDVWWANTVVLDRPPVPRRRAMIDSLRSAAVLWRAPKPGEVVYFGQEAYETWLRTLDDPSDEVMLHGNAFCYASLLTARRAAAEYLRMVADESGGDAAGHIRAAADHYESIADRLYAGRECVTQPWQEKWTPENRATESAILRKCMADEEAAVAEVAAALHALGEPVPEPLRQDGGGTPGDSGEVVLGGLKRHGMPMNQLGNLLACARYLGYEESDAWLSGATAFAFALNVGEDLCGSGPSAWSDHKLLPLAANAGLPIRTFYGSSDQPDFVERQKNAFAEVRKAIDAGMPVIGTEMDTPEVYLVPGYDVDGNYIYTDFVDDRLKKHHHGELGFLWFQFPALGEPADDRTTVREALSTALRLATGEGFSSPNCGLRAYENWIAGLEPGSECDALGAAYNAACWTACRRQAASFLREGKERLGDPALAPHFDAAVRHYAVVADRLNRVSELFPLAFGDPAMKERLADSDRRAEARKLLAEARDAEIEGLRALVRIAVGLGAEGAQDALDAALASVATGGDDLQQDGGGAYREVLLDEAVADFRHIADDVAGHRIETCVRGADEDIYPQPYCYLTTLLIQMHAAGWKDIDLETLAAVSGASAFFGYERGEFGPKYAFHHRDPNGLVAQATGYGTGSVRAGDAAEAWEFVRESVDSGRPVSGWHGELMLLAGYRDADEEADRQVFAMKDGNGYFAEWWDWETFAEWVGGGQHLSRHSGRVEPEPEREVALRVIRDLVALSEGVPESVQKAFPNATFGLAGIEAWAADCADMEEHEDWGMCHPENPQWTVRNSTAIYLERLAEKGVPSAQATEHVRRASESYRAAYRSWQGAYGLVGYAAPDGSGKVKEKRLAAADAVRRAAEHERAAIAELRLALQAEGVEMPEPFAQDGAGREPVEGEGAVSERVMLEDVPPSGGEGNGYVRGIEVLLAHAGTPVSYERLMALSGMAFVAQADLEHRWGGKVDVGWWPLDTWGLEMRLGFLSDAVGWELREVGWSNLTEGEAAAAREDLPAFYRERVEPHVKRSIDAGRPVLAVSDFGFVISGYDNASDGPPVLGRCACETQPIVGRPDSWPHGLILLGAGTGPMEAEAADVAALRYGVELAYDRAGPHEPRWKNRRFTGRKAFAAWSALLRNTDEEVEDPHHANMVGRLASNREAAATYLREVASRYDGETAEALRDAADSYESVVAQLAECSWQGLAGSMDARRALAEHVDRIAATELEAAGHVRTALRALGEDVPEPFQQDGGGAERSESGEARMLEGLQYPQRTAAEMACVEGALRYLGRDLSPGWLYGGTGHAFAITMAEGVHIASPYAWDKTLYDLAPNIGCRITGMAVSRKEAGDEFPARQREAWDMVRGAIDRGLPCYADRVYAACADYALIAGYDDVGYYYTHGAVSGGPTPWQELGTADIEVLDVWRVEPCEPPPDEEVVRAALEAVLKRAATPDGWAISPSWAEQVSGPAAFDLWAEELESGRALWDAHLYNAQFWHEYRAMAVEFLREAKERLPGRADAAFSEAIGHYTVVRDKLESVPGLSPARERANWKDMLKSPEAARALREAGAAERRGLRALARILAALGGAPPQAFAGDAVQQDGGGRAPEPGEAHMLEGLESVDLTSAELAAVLGALHYLGRDISPGWLYGATGHAFAINMRPTVCVSSPYAWDKTLYDLAPNIGCRITALPEAAGPQGHIGDGVSPARRREVWDMVREAIDRGLPCYAWEVSWMPDYSLVTGYDETGYYYTHSNVDARGGPTPWKEYGSDEVRRVELCEPKPDEEVVKAALQTVLKRGATPDGWITYQGNRSGPAAFDLWADELVLGHAKTGDHAFNAHFWSESRHMAVEFLKEAKERLPGRAGAAFDEAVAHYSVVRDRLEAVAELMPWDDSSKWGKTLQSDEQARLIREAGAAERKGLEALREVLVALGGTPPDLSASPEREARPVRSGEAWRFVLEGVRKVAYHTDRWRFTPFCNALDAALQYLGQEEQYDRLMCTSGAAFRMTWTPKAWDGGNSDILGMAPERLEAMRRAFWSAGYEMVPVAKAEPDDWAEELLRDATEGLGGELTDEAGFRRRIVESIDHGFPVIAFGIIGPPEACLVTGYDERGDCLIGWNCFQDEEGVETDGAGRFRVRDWYPNTHGLLLFGDEVGRPDQDELDREALKWALEVLRTRRVGNSHAGPDAFEAWAADMLNDEYFPEDEVHLRGRLMCHWDSMTVTAFRGGGEATQYLLAAGERNPAMVEHLRAAAECLENEDVVHGVAPGQEHQMERLADHEVRREVADSILHAREMHVEAAEHIEKALLAAGVPEEEVFRAAAETDPSAADAAGPGRRLVLEGVPKVSASGVDGHYALTPFPGCLQACLEYMDDDLGFERGGDYPRGPVYDYLMGTTGAAFRLFWKPGWHEDNRSAWAFGDPDEYFRRGFAAAGYDYTSSGHVAESERKERLRPMAIRSIRDLGRPAIAFGVLGAPCETIIAGYDEGGRVAIGWHYWQEHEVGQPGLEFEPNGYFRKRNWEEKTTGMLLIGDKVGTPERRATYLEALQNALRLIREPMQGERYSGLAAYDAWAEHLLRDEEVTAGGGPGDAYMAHADAADVIALGRHCASCFLEQAAEVLPEAEDDLLAASKCFAAEHDLIWKMWELVSGWRSDEEREKFSRPDVRRQIVPIIRQARDKDAEAADHIEKALLALGVPPGEIPRKEPTGSAQDGGGRKSRQGAAVPRRVVLEDVSKIGYGVIDPDLSTTPWPACLWACLEYMGDDLDFGDGEEYPREAVYAYLTGTTGTAFRLVWKGWGLDNWASWMIYDDAGEIFRRGYTAIGYESVSSAHVPEDEKAERFRSQMIESINRGRPLISHGIVGPPEETIVAGYDEGGDVVIGWSAFQGVPWASPKPDGFEPNGMFRKRNWEAHAHSMGTIGQKTGTPDRRETYTEALQNALRIVRAPSDRGRGLAAYDSWAQHILRDDEIAAGTPDDAFDVHCTAVDMIAEGRHFAVIFLRQAAGFLPEAKDELRAAADCYGTECDLMQRIWDPVGGNERGEDQRQAFLKPEVRRRIVTIIRQARQKDAEAADHIERALLTLGVADDQIAEVPPAGTSPEVAGGPSGKTMLEGLEFPEWTITQLGCMHGCLDYLGRDVSRPWLYGGTAHAFFINIHEDVDLESVTAWDDSFIRDLAPNLGFHVDRVRAVKPHVSEAEWRTAQREAWRFVRRSIQLKQPCYGWELKAPYGDWWLITGYDDAGYYYAGWQTGGPTPWRRLGEQFIPVLDVRAVKLCDPASDEATVRGALVAALEHSRPGWDASADEDAHFGPEAYDAWAQALESGAALHNHHAYNARAWHECRQMAVEFLVEAKRRLPGRADVAFDEAIARYSAVRDRLADVKELTPIDGELGWDEEPKLRNPEAAALVRQAGAAEREGLKALARILVALGGEVSEA